MPVDVRRPLHLAVGVGLRLPRSKARLGESFRSAVLPIKQQVAPHAPLGLVLALTGEDAALLRSGDEVARLREDFEAAGLYVVGMSSLGFRRDADWRSPDRTRYTLDLAWILAGLLPAEGEGDVTTLPLAQEFSYDPELTRVMVGELSAFARGAHEIYESTGRRIAVALVPEPHAALAGAPDVVAFFKGPLSDLGVKLRGHVGVALDACHVAAMYEDPLHTVEYLARESVPILRVRVRSALRVVLPSVVPARVPLARALQEFDAAPDEYPVMERHASGTVRYIGGLAQARDEVLASLAREWRVDYPVAVHRPEAGCLGTSQKEASSLVYAAIREGGVRRFEIDGMQPLDDAVRDFRWVYDRLGAFRKSRTRRAA